MSLALLTSGVRLAKGCDPRLTGGFCLTVAEGFFAAALYFILYFLLQDVFFARPSLEHILFYGGGMLACLGMRILVGFIGLPMIFSGAYAMMGEARLRLANHLRHLPMGWFSRQRGGDLGARLTSDMEMVEQIWSHSLSGIVCSLATVFFLSLFLFWIDWRLSLVLLSGLPLSAIALVWAQNIATKAGMRLADANARLQADMLEYVQGIAVVRLYGRFGMIWQRLEQALKEQFSASIALEVKPAPLLVAYGFILEIFYVMLVLCGVWWLSSGTLAASSLLIFLILALPVHRQLFEVGLSLLLLRFGARALQRIQNIIDEPVLPEPIEPKMPKDTTIVFDHVSFAYETEESGGSTLEDISCTIKAGQVTALVGSSGAGKSSFVHLIARLWDVDKGAICLGGIDVRDIATHILHQHIGMVFQDVLLFSGTVFENLRVGKSDASRQEVMEVAKRAQAHDFICALPQGYDTMIEEGGRSLSGGERQRISIARALLKDAPVLLLDEATASLDPSAEAEIQRGLACLVRGRTVVLIAHRLKTVRHADQILVLNQGRLVEWGRHEELLQQNGFYTRMWAKQSLPEQIARESEII